MIEIEKINVVAEKMLLSRISKDSDFYEYIKKPAVIKVVLYELMKEADKRTTDEIPYVNALKEVINSVELLFENRKKVYTKLNELGVTKRDIHGLSSRNNMVCKERIENLEVEVMELLQQVSDEVVNKSNVEERVMLLTLLTQRIGQLQQIDIQMANSYQTYDKPKTQVVERTSPYLEFSVNNDEFEYYSEISTETLKSTPKHRRARYVSRETLEREQAEKNDNKHRRIRYVSRETLEREQAEKIENANNKHRRVRHASRDSVESGQMGKNEKKNDDKKHYRPNKKKTKLPVLVGIAILTLCIGASGMQAVKNKGQLERKEQYLAMNYEQIMESDDSDKLANIIIDAVNDPKIRYKLPQEITQSFLNGNMSSEKFVDFVFDDLGNKIIAEKNVVKPLRFISENYLKYRIYEAISEDIQHYGADSNYKKYENELSIENIELKYEGPSMHVNHSGGKVYLGNNCIFDNTYNEVPSNVESIITCLKKEVLVDYGLSQMSQEEIECLYANVNRLRGQELKVFGKRLDIKTRSIVNTLER